MFLIEYAEKYYREFSEKADEYNEKYYQSGNKRSKDRAYYYEELRDICKYAIDSYFNQEEK